MVTSHLRQAKLPQLECEGRREGKVRTEEALACVEEDIKIFRRGRGQTVAIPN